MTRLSTTSNPTELREITKNRIGIDVFGFGEQRYFQVVKLDLQDMGLKAGLSVVCIAKAGNTSQRFELGCLPDWSNTRFALRGLDASLPLRFRILVHAPDSPTLIASAENLKPVGADNVESLLPMEPAELGQRLWRLDVSGEDGPVLQFNNKVFPSAHGVNSFPPFGALVLPEALSQVFAWILEAPEDLEDENSARGAWRPWLNAVGVPAVPADEDDLKVWREEAVARFCDRYSFADSLSALLQQKAEL